MYCLYAVVELRTITLPDLNITPDAGGEEGGGAGKGPSTSVKERHEEDDRRDVRRAVNKRRGVFTNLELGRITTQIHHYDTKSPFKLIFIQIFD